jgi:predicted transcriptional regulator
MASGRNTTLGDLERAVLDHVWSAGAQDVKACHLAVGKRRRITLNTVQSTMERLYRKGLLRREKVSHAYVYEASVSREELGARLAREVVASVVGSADAAPVLAAFVDLAERAGEDALARLERLVAARRAAQREPS